MYGLNDVGVRPVGVWLFPVWDQCGTHFNRDAVEKVAALLVLCQDEGIRGVISGESRCDERIMEDF